MNSSSRGESRVLLDLASLRDYASLVEQRAGDAERQNAANGGQERLMAIDAGEAVVDALEMADEAPPSEELIYDDDNQGGADDCDSEDRNDDEEADGGKDNCCDGDEQCLHARPNPHFQPGPHPSPP
jgi:hypothetical protein